MLPKQKRQPTDCAFCNFNYIGAQQEIFEKMISNVNTAMASCRRDNRRRAIIDAAEQLFLSQGYDQTNLADIVKLSGGSLATLYAMFGNKKGLLRAIAEEWQAEAQYCPFQGTEPDCPPSELLMAYASNWFAIMKAPRTVGLARMIILESFHDRDFAVGIYDQIHLPRITEVSNLFHRWAEKGIAKFSDPDAAARLFTSMIFADAHFKTLVGIDEGAMEKQQLEWSVRLFCDTFDIR